MTPMIEIVKFLLSISTHWNAPSDDGFTEAGLGHLLELSETDVCTLYDSLSGTKWAVQAIVRRKGLPEVRLVVDWYKEVHTVIKQGTVQVHMRLQYGVKQNDLPSPYRHLTQF